MPESPQGIHEAEVTRWLATRLPHVSTPLTFGLIADGGTTLTYRVEDADGRSWALRRPSPDHVRRARATTHDLGREYRVLEALAPAGIPVPAAVALCTDESVDDHPFVVSEFVEGHILRDARHAEVTFDESTRGVVGDHVADVLAALHDVDPAAIGLGNLGRHEGALERQLTRWREQFDRMEGDTLDEGGLDGGGLVEWVGETLTRRIPAPQRTSVVHGSYRMDNVVLAEDGSVRAVLGWALCTLGDPLTDVGLMLVSWPEPDDTLTLLGPSPSTAPGFSTRAQLLKHYGEASGLDVSGVGYYTAFGYWKLAWILRGLYARSARSMCPARSAPETGAGTSAVGSPARDGDMVGHAWEGYPAQISRLFEMAAEALESVP